VYGPYHMFIHNNNSTYVYIDVAFEFTFPTNRTMLLLTDDDKKLSLRATGSSGQFVRLPGGGVDAGKSVGSR
jgi:hypothetical protein